MGNVRIKVPGVAGKIEARALRVHKAVVAEMDRVMMAKIPKPKPASRRTFKHIRDYREAMK